MTKTKKILVVSDSHGQEEPLRELKRRYKDADLFLHCGDSQMESFYMEDFYCVQGNTDFWGEYPLKQIVAIPDSDLSIFLVHGHMYLYGKDCSNLVNAAKGMGCQLVCFGHTHVPEDVMVGNVRLMNPGSLRCNRSVKFPMRTYMVLEITGEDVVCELHEYPSGELIFRH